MLSFWEIESMLNYDCVIVGSGIVGLSTAISLKEEDANKSVLVLERGILPTGASTKNAGFACFGSVSELLADLETMSEEDVRNLVNERWSGLQLLRLRLGDEEIDYQQNGGYELLFEGQEHLLEKIDYINELLKPIFGETVFVQKDEMIEEFGFNTEKVKHLIFNKFEGQINTGWMMKNLQEKAKELKIHVFTGCKATAYEKLENGIKVSIENEETLGLELTAQNLIICNNAFAKELLPELEIQPGRGQVLVTNPIENLTLKGVFHYQEGYYYFRNYGDRIIFGGGRNLDFEGEKTTDIAITDNIINKLKTDLKELIAPNLEFEIDHQWAGIMAFGPNKQPIAQKLKDNIFVGVRLGGMGVAIGSRLGEQLANLVEENEV